MPPESKSSSGPIPVPVDPDLMDLIPDFLDNRRTDARALREALEAGDLEVLSQVGHSLKGLGGGYGFDEITRLGAEIEGASHAGDVEVIRRAIGDLDDYLSRVEPFPDSDAQ